MLAAHLTNHHIDPATAHYVEQSHLVHVLPFPCTPENNAKMKQWLLQTYSSSTFNTCPHRPIPCMSGPPLEIHLNKCAALLTCHKAAPNPVHWAGQVYEELLRDESLGIIEHVPYGEPVTWCHCMVITRKHDGSPLRTVDLSRLNKHCKREIRNPHSMLHVAFQARQFQARIRSTPYHLRHPIRFVVLL